MKSILLSFILLFAFSIVGSTQTVMKSKISDNWYVGLNAGLSVKPVHVSAFKNLNPTVGVRVGRYLTPVFGWSFENQLYLDDKGYFGTKTNTAIAGMNTSLLGTVNFTNWFGGYLGEPRGFDVVGIAGLGWGHIFGHVFDDAVKSAKVDCNFLTTKVGFDFMLNIGSKKVWQVYVEPSMTYNMEEETQFHVNRSTFGLAAGLIYKFRNSNGTHNFTIAKLYNQVEVDALNKEINRLRNNNAERISVETVVEKPIYVGDIVVVTFAQGKSDLSNEAKSALDQIEPKTNVSIKAMASPEGDKKLNKKLSEERARTVKGYLEGRDVKVKSAKGLGVMGEASNRVAIVTVE